MDGYLPPIEQEVVVRGKLGPEVVEQIDALLRRHDEQLLWQLRCGGAEPARARKGVALGKRPDDLAPQYTVLLDAAKHLAVCAPCGWGKTRAGLSAALYGRGPVLANGLPLYLGARQGAKVAYVTSTTALATLVYDQLRNEDDATSSGVGREVRFSGGGCVIAMPHGNAANTGYSFSTDAVVFDEAAEQPELVWHRNTQQWAMFLSTTKVCGAWPCNLGASDPEANHIRIP